ncbi:MAG: hypothetical protein Q9193_003006 [Seirophora villosa]
MISVWAILGAVIAVDAAGPAASPDISQWLGYRHHLPFLHVAGDTLMRISRPNIDETSALTLPNSFPIRNTPYNITFQPPTVSLTKDDVLNCFADARNQIAQHIEQHGDGPIPPGPVSLDYRYGTVFFGIESVPTPTVRPVSYSDAAAIMISFALKTTQDGFRQRSAEIVMTDSGERVGAAFLGHIGNAAKDEPPERIPNPFPLPNTPFSLDFDSVPAGAEPLPPANVDNCLMTIRQEILQHIRRHGNGPVSSIGFRINDIDFDIIPAQQQTPLSYQDLLAMLRAIRLKMGQQGYYGLYAEIIMTEGREILGDVQIFRADFGRSRADRKSKASE